MIVLFIVLINFSLLFSEIILSLNCGTMQVGLEVGDCCFAHVRGYPWWPAKVTNRSNRKYCLTFFGTRETAWLPSRDLRSISLETIQKFNSPASMRRKHFGEGFKEMMKLFSNTKETSLSSINPVVLREISNNVGVATKSSLSTKKLKIRNGPREGSFEYLHQLTAALKEKKLTDIEIIVKIENVEDLDDSLLDLIDDEALGRNGNTLYQCEICGKSYENQASVDKHHDLDHRNCMVQMGIDFEIENQLNNSEKAAEGFNDESESEKAAVKVPRRSKKNDSEKGKAAPKEKSKDVTIKVNKGSKKKRFENNVVKSLREQELENGEKFYDNVEIRNSCYHCKICKKFSTITELLAKSHIVLCGKRRKRGRPQKISSCLECSQEFTSLKDLKRHHKKDHICASYTCSSCLHEFTHRPSYIRHIQSHKYLPKLECSVVDCGKTFRYGCDLKRHLVSHAKSKQLHEKVGLL